MEQYLKVLKVEVSTLRNLRYIRSLGLRKVGVCRSQILGSQNLSSLRKKFHRYTVDKPTANNSHKRQLSVQFIKEGRDLNFRSSLARHVAEPILKVG